jgi:Ca2+-binding EF-hand superfamily protein
MKLYKKYDKTNKGYFDFNDLKRVAKELKEEMNE